MHEILAFGICCLLATHIQKVHFLYQLFCYTALHYSLFRFSYGTIRRQQQMRWTFNRHNKRFLSLVFYQRLLTTRLYRALSGITGDDTRRSNLSLIIIDDNQTDVEPKRWRTLNVFRHPAWILSYCFWPPISKFKPTFLK